MTAICIFVIWLGTFVMPLFSTFGAVIVMLIGIFVQLIEALFNIGFLVFTGQPSGFIDTVNSTIWQLAVQYDIVGQIMNEPADQNFPLLFWHYSQLLGLVIAINGIAMIPSDD